MGVHWLQPGLSGLSDVSLAYNMVVSNIPVLLVLLYRYIMVLGGVRKRPTKPM